MPSFKSLYQNYTKNYQNGRYLDRYARRNFDDQFLLNRIQKPSVPLVTIDKSERKVNFIINSILAIYDKDQDKNKKTDGKIDLAEFRSVKKEDYEKYVNEIKAYYKQTYNEDLNYHIPTYSELEQMLVENGQFDAKKSVITYDEIADPVFADGIVMQSNQKATGECYQDASNIALSLTPSGRILLQRSVTFDKNTDTYTVTLYGGKQKDGKPFIFKMSASDLAKAQEEYIDYTMADKDGNKVLYKNQKRYTTGSASIVLFDKAIEAYRKSIGYVPPERHRKENKGYDDYLSAGFTHKNIELITGCKSKSLFRSNKITTEAAAYTSQLFGTVAAVTASGKQGNAYSPENVKKRACLLSYASNLSSNVAMTCTFIPEVNDNENIRKMGIVTRHAYVVKSINNDYVELINPWWGKAKPIRMSMNDFLINVDTCDVNDLF